MIDAIGPAGLVLELATNARCASDHVLDIGERADVARCAAAIRARSPFGVDARPGRARGMVDAICLAGFVLELPVTARGATGYIGDARETAGEAIRTLTGSRCAPHDQHSLTSGALRMCHAERLCAHALVLPHLAGFAAGRV